QNVADAAVYVAEGTIKESKKDGVVTPDEQEEIIKTTGAVILEGVTHQADLNEDPIKQMAEDGFSEEINQTAEAIEIEQSQSPEAEPSSDPDHEVKETQLEGATEEKDTEYWSKRRVEALDKVDNLRMTDEELMKIGDVWDLVTIDKEALERATEKNGNPNRFAVGPIIGDNKNLPMSADSLYRHVRNSSAIADLMNVGFVRSRREAAGAEDIPGKGGFGTTGSGVYWNQGEEGKNEIADIVIESDKEMASKGYVTIDGVKGIWVTDKESGKAINLIANSRKNKEFSDVADQKM
ncbi:MAG: hypothetical protein LBE03_00835, partial [Candidatus Nomurabacteria bacterium]|nr:hypothetical protein [Candidatus Nomurabacteria bacterium]